MDYEKKYNEALEDMRVIYPNLKGDAKLAVEHAFPELRESEDERIRTSIYTFFQGMLEGHEDCYKVGGFVKFEGIDVKSILAWLEKQKDVASERVSGYSASISSEQKPDNLDESEKIAAAYQLGRSDERKQKEQMPEKWEDWKNKINILYCSSDEQKSVEKQDYSGLNDFERAIHRGFICAGVKNVPVTIIKETAQDCLAQIPDEISYGEYLQYGERQYARGYKDGADSVKPVEWSEKDNIGWDEAFACVTSAEKAAKNEEELQNAVTAEKWLKEIKFKYYVHPIKQEWSEEDEKMLDSVIRIITHFDDLAHEPTYAGPKWTHPYTKEIAWLKSFRPNKQN